MVGMTSFESLYQHFDDLLLTIIICVVAVYFCNVLRELILHTRFLAAIGMDTDDCRLGAAEVIGTLEATVIALELNLIILDLFGVPLFVLGIFIILVWQSKRPADLQYYANPLPPIAKYVNALRGLAFVERVHNFGEFLIIVLLGEFAGAALGYQFTMLAWSYSDMWTFWKTPNYHMARYSSPWKTMLNVSPSAAMAIEGGFCFLSYLWQDFIRKKSHFQGDTATLLYIAGRMILCRIAGAPTGGFLNPIQASALEIFTVGASTRTKLLVFWLGPIIGQVIACLVVDRSL